MEGEFTNFCRQYYELLLQLEKQEKRFNTLLNKALPYTGQIIVAELDAIISCNRKIQKVRTALDDIITSKQKTERTILQILAYFEIPPHTTLRCEVSGEMELEIWADDENVVHCIKTKDLNPVEEDPNVITIRMTTSNFVWKDDDEY